MPEFNSNNGNKTKLVIFSRDIFKCDTKYFFIKRYSNISMTFKIEIESKQ